MIDQFVVGESHDQVFISCLECQDDFGANIVWSPRVRASDLWSAKRFAKQWADNCDAARAKRCDCEHAR